MPRPPRPEDLYRLRIATEPRLSPDGRLAVVVLQTVAPPSPNFQRRLTRPQGHSVFSGGLDTAVARGGM